MSDIVSISSLNHAAANSQLQLDHTRAASQAAPTDSESSATITGASGDSVALSGAAGLIHQALNAGSSASADRVQQLKQQIESGQYVVDPAAISNAVLNASITGE